MSSANLWLALKTRIDNAGGRAVRVENKIGSGMPDVIYTLRGSSGLVELKWARALPANETSRCPVDKEVAHLRRQLNWAERWRWAGGTSFILFQGWREYMLLNPARLPKDGSALTLAELRATACATWRGSMGWGLTEILISGCGCSLGRYKNGRLMHGVCIREPHMCTCNRGRICQVHGE